MIVYRHCCVCNAIKLSPSNNSTTCIECLASGYKWCATCKQSKPTAEFEVRNGKVGSICKECKNAKQKFRYKTDEQFRAKMNKSAQEYSNNRYATDEQFRQSEIVRKHKRKAAGTLTQKEWAEILQVFNNSCAYCGAINNLTLDHIVPISKGGISRRNNVVVACLSCNSSKQAKDITEWYTKQQFFSKERLAKILEWKEGESRAPKRK